MIDWAAIIEKVPEMAMVIVVVVFALKMTESQRQSSKEVMAEWREFLNKRDGSWREYIQVRDEVFISTLIEIREQQVNSTARLAEELKSNTVRLEELSTTLRIHNDDVIRRMDNMK